MILILFGDWDSRKDHEQDHEHEQEKSIDSAHLERGEFLRILKCPPRRVPRSMLDAFE
jgi:hypothetical protein